MRRFSAPVAHLYASKLCIYMFFMNENQRLKFQIVAFSSSKCTYGLDFEDSGSSGICLHTGGLRKIFRALVFKCDDAEFRKLKKFRLHHKATFLTNLTPGDSIVQLSKFNIVAFRGQLSDNQFNF